MPNSAQLRTMFKLAAREAKANRVASMTLLEQTAYILLVAGEQARNQRKYSLALEYRLTRAVVIASSSMAEAWSSLQEEGVLEVAPTEPTPASNTGVTECPATVPLEYFTGGK